MINLSYTDDDLEQGLQQRLQSSSKTKEEQVDVLLAGYTKLFHCNKELQKQYDDQMSLTDEISTNFTSLEERLIIKLKENSGLTKKLYLSSRNYTKALSKIKEMEKELRDARAAQKSSIQEKVSKGSKEKIESFRSKLKEMKSEKEELFLKIDELQSRLKVFDRNEEMPGIGTFCDMQGHASDATSLEKQLSSKIDDNFKLRKELETAVTNNRSLIGETKRMNSKLENIRKEKQDLQNTVAALEKQAQKGQNSANQVKALQVKLDAVTHEKQKLIQSIKKLEKDIETFQNTNEEAMTNLKIALKHANKKKHELLLNSNTMLNEKLNSAYEEVKCLKEVAFSAKRAVNGLVDSLDCRATRIKNITTHSNPMLRNRLRSDLLASATKDLRDVKTCITLQMA